MKKVLFVSYGGGHINIINELVKGMIDNKNIEFTVLALTTAYNNSINLFSDKYVKKISDYKELFNDNIKDIEKYGNLILDENYNPTSGISKEDTLIYLGLSMFDLVQKYGENEALRLYKEKKRQAFLPIETMKKILKYENTTLLVTTTSPRFEEASVIAANDLGIETLQILDLFGELYPLPKANHIVCMNESISNSLKKQGLVDSKYYFLGQPAIERTAKNTLSLSQSIISNRLNLEYDTSLLYATTTVPAVFDEDLTFTKVIDYKIINDKLFDIFADLYNEYKVNILIRLHPNEDSYHYTEWFKKYPFVKHINDKCNLEESLAVCDILVNRVSTVSLEAIAAKKVVFTFKIDMDKIYPLPELAKEPFVFSDGFDKLRENLHLYFQGKLDIKESNKFLPFDSVKNIVKLIGDLA